MFAAVIVGVFAAPAVAANQRPRHAVFVQTNAAAGNEVVAYEQQEDGTLTSPHSYSTGGNGGALSGAVVDRLASQGSLTFDPQHALLFAVNAGSNTVSVFAVDGSHLSLREIVPSGGEFPVRSPSTTTSCMCSTCVRRRIRVGLSGAIRPASTDPGLDTPARTRPPATPNSRAHPARSASHPTVANSL